MNRPNKRSRASIVAVIGVAIALVTSLVLTNQTRPASGIPAVPAGDYLAASGHRAFMTSLDGPLITETSHLPGGTVFLDAPEVAQAALEQINDAATRYWVREQIASPTGGARDEYLSLTSEGLSLHAVVSDASSYHLNNPGVVAMPFDPEPGMEWTSQATAVDQDDTSSQFTRVGRIEDSSAPGCLDVTYTDTLDGTSVTSRLTRCPDRGIIRIEDAQPSQPPARDATPWLGPTPQATGVAGAPEQITLRTGAVAMSLGVTSSPVALGDGLLLVNRSTGQLNFFAETTGADWQLDWRQRPGEQTLALLGAGRMAIAATTGATLVAYDARGRWLWQQPTSDLVANLVRLDDQRFAALTLDGRISVRSLATGKQEWAGAAPAGGRPIPQVLATAEGPLVVAAAGVQLEFIWPDGTTRQHTLGGSAYALATAGDRIWVADSNAQVLAYDTSGDLVWESSLIDPCNQLVAVGDQVICRSTTELVALGPGGNQLWAYQWAGQDAIAVGDQVLVSGTAGSVLLDSQGQLIEQWSAQRQSATLWHVPLSDGLLVIGSAGEPAWWSR